MTEAWPAVSGTIEYRSYGKQQVVVSLQRRKVMAKKAKKTAKKKTTKKKTAKKAKKKTAKKKKR